MTPRCTNGARAGGRVAVVLPGGGARGAYEIGALSVLLPALAARGERVESGVAPAWVPSTPRPWRRSPISPAQQVKTAHALWAGCARGM